MHFKRLEIQGFKTFAARTVLEFRPGVTAVVGPNGSGKSNVADAVRWVLGEQSFATLRCKRSEELIYAGGGRRPPAGLAEVSLTLDNSDRLLPLDFDEVTLTRRATRSGESDYFINRARVRLRDLLEATAPLGGSYTIINQGLVDAALTLRPEERRRLFEDAAELSSFELRKSEAVRRLRETESNLSRVADLLAELEPRLRILKRQATQAHQYHALNEELCQVRMQYYALLWREAQALTTHTAAELTRCTAELTAARTTQAKVNADLAALRGVLRERREALGALQQQANEQQQRAAAAQRDLAVGRERSAALARRLEDLERQHDDLAQRRNQTEAQHASATTDLTQASATLAERRQALQQAEAQQASMESERHSLRQALRHAQDAALRAATGAAEQQTRSEQLAAQATRLEREASELAATLDQAAQRLAAAQAQQAQATQQLADAEAAQAQLTHAEQTVRQQLDQQRSARTHADEARAAARRQLADAEARYESLNRLARAYSGTFAGVRAAMQWAERSQRPGFALVQSIIRTPANLETAIEVALGSRLQNIVVEHWADAEAAIAELKRSGAGRATFMPLDTLRGGGKALERESGKALERESGEASLPPDPHSPSPIPHPPPPSTLGIAADLVGYEERYAAVVRQLLGRVLVVRDLATARREVRQLSGGWNIVTLGGEQVNSGGSLTGGAQVKESGALRRERELRELPAQVAAARAAVAEAEAQWASLDAAVQSQTSQLRELEGQLREGRRRLENARSALDAATRRARQAQQEQDWAKERGERIAQESATLQAQRTQVAQTLTEAQALVERSTAELDHLRVRQEAEAQAERSAQEQLNRLRSAVSAAEAHMRSGQSLVQAHAQSLALLGQQAQQLAQSRAALQNERDALLATQTSAEALHATLHAASDELRAQIAPAEAALQQDETQQSAHEAAEAAATAALRAAESAQSRAALEAQRASDRQEALLERAASEGVDVLAPTVAPADGAQAAPLQAAMETLKAKILRLGAVNPLALAEHEELAERQRFVSSQVADLQAASATLLELISELDAAMQSRFRATFTAVASEFEQSFTRLFGGGSAKLLLTNSNNSSDEGTENHNQKQIGIEIIARPPGKKQQNIALLSGGERSLTAAALLFAILKVNPSPFCILDETDAALDEANVGRFRDALSQLTSQTQFILISHNRGTIEAADTLYGVTMGDDGASKIMSLRVAEYVAEAI
ncbi:MAG: chromosome segregation protein SMC [Candidatus Viridilinea halotolerans]|uniref:Chromosome partition protein Smc n=1 Tax=Candidatus Viridilinea halotolerans TaxID=2491704 RepID=A0A426TVY4_9CHLR|nr:MAG: chromosome segregation protein SMC [Candidatus Viridilinea halotolerans]